MTIAAVHGRRRPLILLVEDEPLIRMDLANSLESNGYDVVEACSAPEAWAWMCDNATDLLMTDISMPGDFDGLELARRTRTRYPALPILIVTAHPLQALGEWASVMLSKPVTHSLLLERVGAALASNAYRPRILSSPGLQ